MIVLGVVMIDQSILVVIVILKCHKKIVGNTKVYVVKSVSSIYKEELPKIRQEKVDRGIKCLCDDPTCYKCIGVDCNDDKCFTHPLLAKLLARKDK